MKRERFSFGWGVWMASSAISAFLAACGGDGEATSGNAFCGEGTLWSAEIKRCLPDESACAGGTRFDAASNACVPDETLCGEDTVLLHGTCVLVDDTITGDVTEGVEPNDRTFGGTPAELALPAENKSITFTGCITPADFDGDGTEDDDYDEFLVTVDAPTLVRVAVDGVHGLNAAFLVRADDEALSNDAWQRIGIDPSSDMAERDVFLPKAGTFSLRVGDFRSLVFGPSGNERTCYAGSLKRLPLPAASTVALGDVTMAPFGAPGFYSLTTSKGQIPSPLVAADPDAAKQVIPALVVLKGNTYVASIPSESFGGFAAMDVWGAGAGDVYTFVADYEFEAEVGTAGDYYMAIDAIPSAPLPADGSPSFTYDESLPFKAYYFDGTEGDVGAFVFDGNSAVTMSVYDATGTRIARKLSSAQGDGELWFQIPSTGIYYLLVSPTGLDDGQTFTMDETWTAVTPTVPTLGVPTNVSLASVSRGVFLLNVASADWASFAVSSLSGLSTVKLRAYPFGATGSLDADLAATRTATLNASSSIGHVLLGLDESLLVTVENNAAHTAGESFEFTVSERDHNDLGTRSPANPLPATSYAFGGDGSAYFLVRAAEGAAVTLDASPLGGEDLRIVTLTRAEVPARSINDAGAGGAESGVVRVDASGFIAFAVERVAGAGASFSLAVTAEAPAYAAAAGSTAFVDVCANADVKFTTDERYISTATALAPLAFSFFGAAETTMKVSTDGWLTFDTYSGSGVENAPLSFPNTGETFHAVVAPAWTWLEDVTVCIKRSSTAVTIEWKGVDGFGAFLGETVPAEFETVLHANGTIDFVYGPNHAVTGAVVGMEDRLADAFVNVHEEPVAGSSIRWTPAN